MHFSHWFGNVNRYHCGYYFLCIDGIRNIIDCSREKRRELAKLFKEYTARLATDPLRSIDQLAAATGVAVETAKENILEMIDKGYFVNTYVDFDRNCLVFLQVGGAPESASTQQSESSVEYASVSCPGCGATNRIRKGTVGECEFCGNPLSEK